jgi:hypothetical protein
MGRPDCRIKGNAAASAGGAGWFYEITGRRKQQVAAAELSVPQDLIKDYGPTGSSGRRRRHDHETLRERADASVRWNGALLYAK